jgi:hypothetical protein
MFDNINAKILSPSVPETVTLKEVIEKRIAECQQNKERLESMLAETDKTILLLTLKDLKLAASLYF